MELIERDGALYSPRQIFWATFFGGPFALTYLLSRNFASQGLGDLARRYFAAGVAASLLVLAVNIFVPINMSVATFIACAFAGQHMARNAHFSGAKAPPQDCRIHSTWRVALVVFAAFMIWAAVAVLAMQLKVSMGTRLPH